MKEELSKMRDKGQALAFLKHKHSEEKTKELFTKFQNEFEKLNRLMATVPQTLDICTECYMKLLNANLRTFCLEQGLFEQDSSGLVNSQHLFIREFVDFSLSLFEELEKLGL